MSAPKAGALWRSDHRMRFVDQVCADQTMPANACRIAIALSRYVNSRTRLAWPTQETLAELLGLTERSIRSGLTDLAEAGHIQIIPIVDTRCKDQRRNGYLVIIKDDGKPASESPPEMTDTGSNLPVNTGRDFPVNTGSNLPVNIREESNPLEFNTALARAARARALSSTSSARAANRPRAFEGRLPQPPPDYSHVPPPPLSFETRKIMGLADP